MDVVEKVNNKESSLSNLHARMKRHYDLWSLLEKEREIGDTSVNITLPDPRGFSDLLQFVLSKAERQVIIRLLEESGEDRRDDIAYMERLFGYILDKADERLADRLLPQLRDSLIWNGMIRGWMAARILCHKTKKDNIYDLMNLDPLWITWDVGENGLLWTGYKTFRSETELVDTYGYSPKSTFFSWGKGKPKENIPVIDYWTDEINQVFIEKQFIREQKNSFNRIPIIIMPISSHPPIADESKLNMENYGESIYTAGEQTFNTQNEIASMWASHMKLEYLQPMINYKTDDGTELEKNYFLSEAVINLPMGKNRLESSPMRPISPTMVNLFSMLEARKQQVTVPGVDFGQVGGPPYPSGTAINELKQRNKAFGLLNKHLNMFYSKMCMMIQEQLISSKLSVTINGDIDGEYFEKKVTPVELKVPHTVRVEFTSRTNWEDLEVYQIGGMAKQAGIPDEWAYEHIYKFPDPKGMMDLRAIELVSQSPDMVRMTAIEKLLKLGRKDKAEIILGQLIEEAAMRQAQMQQAGVLPPEGSPEGTPEGPPEGQPPGVPPEGLPPLGGV